MRELFVVAEESTDSMWVFRTLDDERFCIPREDLIPPAPSTLAAVSDSEHDSEDYEVVEAELVDETQDAPTFTLVNPVEPQDEAQQDETQPEEPQPEETPAPVERTPAEPDPLFANPLSLRPNEIQARIRAGASTEELAAEMGVAASRVEPYAHPVLLERAQVAEAAKSSHPVRADGAAPDSLYEILALSFASQGHALSEANWDAVREAGEPWVVRVTWQAGLQEHQAEWFFRRAMGQGATTEPRDAVAADLIDPSFAQPVRSLSPISDNYAPEPAPEPAQEPAQEPRQEPAEKYHPQPDLFAEGDELHAPEETNKPKKRRRKAVTPHWEDVLLGVRTNTKRPK